MRKKNLIINTVTKRPETISRFFQSRFFTSYVNYKFKSLNCPAPTLYREVVLALPWTFPRTRSSERVNLQLFPKFAYETRVCRAQAPGAPGIPLIFIIFSNIATMPVTIFRINRVLVQLQIPASCWELFHISNLTVPVVKMHSAPMFRWKLNLCWLLHGY